MSLTRIVGTGIWVGLAASPIAAADKDLLIFDWSGFEEEAYSAVYAETHGEPPTYTFFVEDEEAFQKLRSGFRADVAQPCPQSIPKWREAGLIEPWDVSKIPNYASVADTFKTNSNFSDDEGVWFIPGHLGATAIAYNTEEVPEEATRSLQVFADPAYAGRISLPDVVDDAFSLAFLATGTSDWTQATEEDLARASDWLRMVHPNVRTYWTDGSELGQLMATGEVLLAWSWNETPVQLRADGHPIGFQREAAEGISQWACGYVNLADGPGSEEKAHDFINGFLDPSVTEYIVSEWGYGHGNDVAMHAIDAELLEEVGLGDVDVPVLWQLPMPEEIRQAMIQEFERIKAGF